MIPMCESACAVQATQKFPQNLQTNNTVTLTMASHKETTKTAVTEINKCQLLSEVEHSGGKISPTEIAKYFSTTKNKEGAVVTMRHVKIDIKTEN